MHYNCDVSYITAKSTLGKNMVILNALTAEEFYNITYRKQTKQTRYGKPKSPKKIYFSPEKWEHSLIGKIWNAIKIKCGFNFKNHYLTNYEGSLLYFSIENFDFDSISRNWTK